MEFENVSKNICQTIFIHKTIVLTENCKSTRWRKNVISYIKYHQNVQRNKENCIEMKELL